MSIIDKVMAKLISIPSNISNRSNPFNLFTMISLMTDNFDFHHKGYITIRPWIRDCLKKLGIRNILQVDPSNNAFFLLNDYKSTLVEIPQSDIGYLVHNEYSKEFFESCIKEYGSLDNLILVGELLNHEHATVLLKPMLDTLVVFEKYSSGDDIIVKWIDEDTLHLILLGMEKDEVKTVKTGVPYLRSLIEEMNFTENTTLERMINFVGSQISNKAGSVDYLKENSIFIVLDELSYNPRWEDIVQCEFTVDSICKNRGAFNLLKHLDPSKISWVNVARFHRDANFIDSNIEYINTDSIWSFVLMNEYLMPVIEKHFNKINPNLLTCLNENASAIEYLKKNRHLVDDSILYNANIVTYDYDKIKTERNEINENIHKCLYHPLRIKAWIEQGNRIEDYLS